MTHPDESLIAQALQEQIDADQPFSPFGAPQPSRHHAFWGTDPSGYCGNDCCEPTRTRSLDLEIEDLA